MVVQTNPVHNVRITTTSFLTYLPRLVPSDVHVQLFIVIEEVHRVANRPDFFRIVRNFLALSGKRRLAFSDSAMSEKIAIVAVCNVISSICLFYSSKQYYRILQNS